VKVLLRANLNQFTGYGRDGVGLVQALLERGHDVRLLPMDVMPPLPRELAGLLCLPVDGPFDLALHHSEMEVSVLSLKWAARSRCNVLWNMWGWDTTPDLPWVESYDEHTQYFDHLLVYDEHSAAAITPHVRDPERVGVLLGGYASKDWADPEPIASTWLSKPPEAPTDPTFTFAMNGRLSIAKGVYTVYSAFQTMLENHDAPDARLVMRSTVPVFPPSAELHPQVHVEVGQWLPKDLGDFYRSVDCLVSPSWAEAKNLPPIEALTCGTPVILSDIPGHRGWATSDMVTFVPAPRRTLSPGYDGGFVDPEDLAEAMWLHYTQRAEQKRKAQLAARTLPAMLDWSRCLERLGLRIGMTL
jgi:glycosyltransferase involved in cell wall biosynthesis